jgi:outer membrane protein OmpA-like peptidoglycan-associated protein
MVLLKLRLDPSLSKGAKLLEPAVSDGARSARFRRSTDRALPLKSGRRAYGRRLPLALDVAGRPSRHEIELRDEEDGRQDCSYDCGMHWLVIAALLVSTTATTSIALAQPVRAPFHVSYDAEHLDLDGRVLQFKMTRPAGSAELIVLGEDGKEIGTGAATYQGERAGTWLSISWTQPADARVLMLKLRVVAGDGLVTNVELTPWSVVVDHEDVNFATNSSVIETGEEAKLDASLAKIAEIVKRSEKFVKMQLYVAGHTDTVGAAAKNLTLSLDRARAIAGYFRRKGLALPIAFAGYGEQVLKAKTPDDTDERANRRADYVIAPRGAPPPFKGPYLKARVAWKQLR